MAGPAAGTAAAADGGVNGGFRSEEEENPSSWNGSRCTQAVIRV